MLEQLKYPIGKAVLPSTINKQLIISWIAIIENFPVKLEALVNDLSQEQLDTPYRNGGWTIRQVIHHCFDSHLNSYTRFKWALTENSPVIKTYYEDRWADLFDSKKAPISLSLEALKGLHTRWVYLLKGLTASDLKKCFIHPETKISISLKENIGIYAWHCKHHFAHIEQLLIRKNWK